MKILVTGATGFIGHEVTRHLADAGLKPRVLVRRLSRAPLVAAMDTEPVFGDLESAPSLERALDGIDAVIHLAGRATFEPYDRLEPTLVDGTTRLAELAAAANVRHIVFGSSLFVHDGGQPVDARTPPMPALDYGRAKVAAERALLGVAAAGGPTVASIRLPHVYGPQSLLFSLIRRRIVPFPGRGDNRFAQLHVVDAARVLVAAALDGWEGTAPLADEETATWNEFFDVLGTFAPRVRVLRIPAGLATAGARIVGPLLGSIGPTLVSPDTIRGWSLDLPVADTPLWRDLDLRPRYPSVREGIPATLDSTVAFRWRHPVADFT